MEWCYDEKYVLLLTRQKVCRAASHFYKVKDGPYCFFVVRGWALLLYNFLKFANSFLRLCGMHLLTAVHNYAIIIAQQHIIYYGGALCRR